MDCPHLRILQCNNMNDSSTKLCGEFVSSIKTNNHILKCTTQLRDIKCKYASPPVKLYDRCVVKGTSDYGKNAFPSCSHILDYLRFDLYRGLNVFLDDIKKGLLQCILPDEDGNETILHFRPTYPASIMISILLKYH